MKNAVVFYNKAKIIIEMREKLLTRAAVAFTFCATFIRAINRPKNDPRLFFFLNLFINGQAFIISGEKELLIFSILCKGVQGKRHKKYYQSAVLLYWKLRKQLWNCYSIYESAVSITSPLKTITDPLK